MVRRAQREPAEVGSAIPKDGTWSEVSTLFWVIGPLVQTTSDVPTSERWFSDVGKFNNRFPNVNVEI